MAGALKDGLDDVLKVIDRIEDRLPFVVGHEELGDVLCAVVEVQNRVDALVGRVGLAASTNLVAVNAGQRTVGQFVAARTNNPSIDIDRAVKRAKWLRDFPVLENSHGAELSDRHVDYLKQNCDTDYDTHKLLGRDQQILADAGASCSFAGFVEAVEHWKIFNDPDGG